MLAKVLVAAVALLTQLPEKGLRHSVEYHLRARCPANQMQRPGSGSRILALGWLSPGHYGNQKIEDVSVYLFLSLSVTLIHKYVIKLKHTHKHKTKTKANEVDKGEILGSL